jgi:hypothetical protein
VVRPPRDLPPPGTRAARDSPPPAPACHCSSRPTREKGGQRREKSQSARDENWAEAGRNDGSGGGYRTRLALAAALSFFFFFLSLLQR